MVNPVAWNWVMERVTFRNRRGPSPSRPTLRRLSFLISQVSKLVPVCYTTENFKCNDLTCVMKKKFTTANPLVNPSNRRNLISRGGAFLGACIVGSSVTAVEAHSKDDGKQPGDFDVKKYGATGIRK